VVVELIEETPERWRIERRNAMRVPGIVFASRTLLPDVAGDLPRMEAYGIDVPDQQLACAPVTSPDGRAYLGAMAAAANYGRANRQLLTETTRRAFDRATPRGELDLLYDVSHSLAKLEWHEISVTLPTRPRRGSAVLLQGHRRRRGYV
jgi:RNA-splicing ligase RtcB